MENATYRFWAGTSLVPKNISWKLGMADRITQWRIVLKALFGVFERFREFVKGGLLWNPPFSLYSHEKQHRLKPIVEKRK